MHRITNIVEFVAEDQHPSPCKHGNIVDGHACYCHADTEETGRKCHIYRAVGESDLTKWYKRDLEEWRNGDKEDGCPFYEVNENYVKAVLVDVSKA